MQIGFVCLVAPAFGGGVWALGFLRGATRRKIPEPPCRGKRDLRAALRVAGFRPLIVAVGCESPVRNFANRRLASWWNRGGVQPPPRTLFRTVIPDGSTLFSTVIPDGSTLFSTIVSSSLRPSAACFQPAQRAPKRLRAMALRSLREFKTLERTTERVRIARSRPSRRGTRTSRRRRSGRSRRRGSPW